jgi:hypothetical protein
MAEEGQALSTSQKGSDPYRHLLTPGPPLTTVSGGLVRREGRREMSWVATTSLRHPLKG